MYNKFKSFLFMHKLQMTNLYTMFITDGKDTTFMAIFHDGRSHVSSPVPRILIASEITARISVLYFNSNKISLSLLARVIQKII